MMRSCACCVVQGPNRIALLPMTPTWEREQLGVRFSEPYFQTTSLSILMKKPRLQYHFFKFITVLEYSVWICITGAYFFTSILLWVFDRTSPYSYQNNMEKYKDDDEKRLFTLKVTHGGHYCRCGNINYYISLSAGVALVLHNITDTTGWRRGAEGFVGSTGGSHLVRSFQFRSFRLRACLV